MVLCVCASLYPLVLPSTTVRACAAVACVACCEFQGECPAECLSCWLRRGSLEALVLILVCSSLQSEQLDVIYVCGPRDIAVIVFDAILSLD